MSDKISWSDVEIFWAMFMAVLSGTSSQMASEWTNKIAEIVRNVSILQVSSLRLDYPSLSNIKRDPLCQVDFIWNSQFGLRSKLFSQTIFFVDNSRSYTTKTKLKDYVKLKTARVLWRTPLQCFRHPSAIFLIHCSNTSNISCDVNVNVNFDYVFSIPWKQTMNNLLWISRNKR